MKKNSEYKKYYNFIVGENVNVSSGNDAKDFFIAITKFIIFILILLFMLNSISDFIIDRMSKKIQNKVESIIFFEQEEKWGVRSGKYADDFRLLSKIKNKIKENDKEHLTDANLDIKILKNRQANAFIYPNGNIYITTAMLNKNLSEEELTFIIAHEVGHYVHRDHLKAAGKKMTVAMLCLSIGLQDVFVNNIISNTSGFETLNYTRNQEKNADVYASNMLVKIYGTNEGGIKLLESYKEKEKNPEYFYFFSTHPSWKKRLRVIKSLSQQ